MILDLGFPGPFLILSGGCSDWTGAPLQSLHAGLFPNARMEVTEGAGHDTAWDRLGATLATIRSFLTAPATLRPRERCEAAAPCRHRHFPVKAECEAP